MKEITCEMNIGASGFGISTFRQLGLSLRRAVSGIFFGRRYDYASATVRASETFSSTLGVGELALAAESFLGATVRPGWVDFFLKDARMSGGFSPVSEESSSALLDEAYAKMVESLFRQVAESDSSMEFSEKIMAGADVAEKNPGGLSRTHLKSGPAGFADNSRAPARGGSASGGRGIKIFPRGICRSFEGFRFSLRAQTSLENRSPLGGKIGISQPGMGAKPVDSAPSATFEMGSTADTRAFGIGAVVPAFSHGRANALLILGRKKSGRPFSSRDKNLLAVISRQVGMAVENVGLREGAKRQSEEMERRVAERTERVKNMHDAQSRFLADLSHEFQTPLTILKMNVEAFAKGSTSERRKAAYMMGTTLDRLSRLARGLVDVARFDSFREAFQGRPVDLADLIKETCDDCQILAKDRDVALLPEGDGGLVLGDRDKLKEALLNLVSNALKNTSSGGAVVLSARRREGEAEIVVADSGRGIPSKSLPLIFERFYRIEGGASEGAGLGLHLCRKIVEAHGGTIIAESSLGQGSRFVIHLPMAEEVGSSSS